MERNRQLLFAGLCALALTACTKEIELGLGDQSKKVVIEAVVSEGPGPHTVRLSRSVAFGTPNAFPAISNATVTLSDDQGNNEQLTETGPGIYSSSAIEGVQGRNYRLTTTVEGKTYIAECRMPQAVPLDTVRVDSLLAFGTYEKVVFAACTDPAGVGNNYHYVLRVNGERQKGVEVQNDQLEDGHTIEQPLNFMDDESLSSGDVVEVTMECISPEVYAYFFSLAQNIGGETSAPADPVSNISGGALGYFSAHTSSTKTAVVP
jgi:hypothetical protein